MKNGTINAIKFWAGRKDKPLRVGVYRQLEVNTCKFQQIKETKISGELLDDTGLLSVRPLAIKTILKPY